MKKILAILLMAVALTVTAQEKQVNLGLIPTPQEVTLSPEGKSCVLAKAKVKEQRVKWGRGPQEPHFDGNWSQAYRLTIEPRKVTIEYEGAKGLEYARLTLAQLRQLHETMPCCTILDWPAYKYRGWMDDQSRGPVPHAAYRQKQWQTLHALKYNFCNYYTEHTLYQPEFPDLAPAYLADCTPHPDEVINLQLFAHAEETLKIPFYEDLMDSRANFNPGNPKVYDFLRKRIKAAYRRIPNSPFFIINCDETEQLGTGRAKKLVDEKGADQVYVDFINRCYEMVKSEGTNAIRLAMWGDIVAKNPEMMRQLPKDMTYIMWAYEPLDSFRHLIAPFKNQGNPFWVAASTGHSATMTSTPQRYIKNIANLYRDGHRDGAEGAMLTCWDDNGEALFDNSWHAQYWAAEMAWNPLKTDDPEELKQRERQFNENYERLFYGDTGKVKDLYAVGALMYNPAVGDWYTSAALMEPLLNFNPDNTGETMAKRIGQVANLLRDIQIDSAANPHSQYAYDRILVTSTKAYLRSSIHRVLTDTTNNVMFSQLPKSLVKVYLEDLFALKREYLRLWDQENGDYERHTVMDRYDALAREVLDLDRHVFMQVGCDATSLHPQVTLRTLYNDRPIYYTLDGSEPDSTSTRYNGPFPLERSATIKAVSYNKYGEGVISEQYLLSHLGMGAKITLGTQYSTYKSIYSGGGPAALVDGQLGSSATYADGHWQGYWGDSIDATIDFGKPTEIHEVTMRFMQNTFDWILAPKEIKAYVSNDGKEWDLVSDWSFDMDPRETGMRLKNYNITLGIPSYYSSIYTGPFVVRYLRVVVPNPGPLPTWHPAPGQPSYIFTDEIIVK
ncbi:MAG: chitobiase/beta-hexosaminidase C-terminal domain-containing protein [Bacteroidales bacterium]|nr:chitobiase/beta-hexosaminidase C-terminal domain-containing protein [Bacteroidales bacterium]